MPEWRNSRHMAGKQLSAAAGDEEDLLQRLPRSGGNLKTRA